MKIRLLGLILVWFFAATAQAAEIKCFVCGQTIEGKYFTHDDLVTGDTRNICTNCAELTDRCFSCGLPTKDGKVTLLDGRVLCARDNAEAVQTEEQAKQICADVVDDLNRLFSRWMEFPNTNALVSIVNRFYLENLFKNPGEAKATVDVEGATTSNHLPGDKFVHSVAILSHLRKARLQAVCAHEFTHAWMGQNRILEHRKTPLAKDMVEAMCELVAHKYMESRQENLEMASIEKNGYTKGKILVLLAADRQYGFNAVLEWLKDGDDAALSLDNLDRIRAVDGVQITSQSDLSSQLYVSQRVVAPAAPSTLMLKSISGSANRRFAMINSTTFELMEKANVRVGQTNLTVRCLEISNNSVTVQVEGSGEKKQLFLGASNP